MTQEAFVSLLKPLQDRLFRTAFRMLLNEEDAKDAVQDVFMKLWNKRAELEKCNSIEAWCLTVTRNTVLDKIKSNKYRLTEPYPSTLEISTKTDRFETRDLFNLTRAIINDLPEKQRMLIYFRDVEGLTYEMVAEIMDMTLGEVKIGLFRSRKLIREKINKIISYDGS